MPLFRNAFIFNDRDSEIYKHAKKLEAKVKYGNIFFLTQLNSKVKTEKYEQNKESF